jgi:hypothetical protein
LLSLVVECVITVVGFLNGSGRGATNEVEALRALLMGPPAWEGEVADWRPWEELEEIERVAHAAGEMWDIVPERLEEFERVVQAAAAILPDIARIPDGRRDAFRVDAADDISGTLGLISLPQRLEQGGHERFDRVREAAGELVSAVRELNDDELLYLANVFNVVRVNIAAYVSPKYGKYDTPLNVAMPYLLRTACNFALGDYPNSGGNFRNITFKLFVHNLWKCANKHGGELTANCKRNVGVGGMYRALDALRPYFPADFIQTRRQAQTIANIVRAARNGKPHPLGT